MIVDLILQNLLIYYRRGNIGDFSITVTVTKISVTCYNRYLLCLEESYLLQESNTYVVYSIERFMFTQLFSLNHLKHDVLDAGYQLRIVNSNYFQIFATLLQIGDKSYLVLKVNFGLLIVCVTISK